MTLQDAINWIGQNANLAIFYMLLPPFTALVMSVLAKGEGHLSPWRYLYSVLIYAVCIPGVFSVAFNAYFFLFERRSILESDLFTQILPIFSMIATLLIIRRNTDLNNIPGFDNIGGLVTIISSVMVIMWFLDKVRIVIFSYLPFWQLIAILVGLVLIVRYGWWRMTRK